MKRNIKVKHTSRALISGIHEILHDTPNCIKFKQYIEPTGEMYILKRDVNDWYDPFTTLSIEFNNEDLEKITKLEGKNFNKYVINYGNDVSMYCNECIFYKGEVVCGDPEFGPLCDNNCKCNKF